MRTLPQPGARYWRHLAAALLALLLLSWFFAGTAILFLLWYIAVLP